MPSTEPLPDTALVYKKKACRLVVQVTDLVIQTSGGGIAAQISLADAYGVQAMTAPAVGFTVYTAKEGKKLESKRKKVDYHFNCDAAEKAAEFVSAVSSMLATTPSKVLVLLNPFGGTKKAVKLFQSSVKPMFDLANKFDYDVVETTHAGHAREHLFGLGQTLYTYSAVVTVSGDGLFQEALNGIMTRPDWEEAASRISLGIIPAGSGNAFARSLYALDVVSATLAVIKGNSRPLDLLTVQQDGEPMLWSHLLFMWGLVADIDIESERYRWAGSARFTFSGVGRILSLRKYKGKVTYLPWDRDAPPTKVVPNASGAAPVSIFDTPLDTAAWKEVEGEFVHVMAMNTGWQSNDVFFAPFSAIDDGAIDLSWILKDDGTTKVKTRNMLPMMLDTETPPLKKEFFAYTKVKAFTCEAHVENGIFDVDGEVVPYKPVKIENHYRLGRVLCHPALSLPEFPLTDLPVEGLHTHAAKPMSVGGAGVGGGGGSSGGGAGVPAGGGSRRRGSAAAKILRVDNV